MNSGTPCFIGAAKVCHTHLARTNNDGMFVYGSIEYFCTGYGVNKSLEMDECSLPVGYVMSSLCQYRLRVAIV